MVDNDELRVDDRERDYDYPYPTSKAYKVAGSTGVSTGVKPRSRRGTLRERERERDWEREREEERILGRREGKEENRGVRETEGAKRVRERVRLVAKPFERENGLGSVPVCLMSPFPDRDVTSHPRAQLPCNVPGGALYSGFS